MAQPAHAGLFGRRALSGLALAGILAVVATRAAASPRCGAPEFTADGWAVAAPAEPALDVDALCQALPRLLSVDANVHGLVVERGGRLQFEAYFDGWDNPGGSIFARPASFGPDTLHDLRSVTKSITGLLVGVALERGLIDSLDQPVLDFFPEHTDLHTPERRRITLAHLLTMSAGLAWDESGSYARPGNSETRMRFAADPDRYVLERDVAWPPGTHFVYSGGASALLGEVLVRRAGMPLERFADELLFAPLGIVKSEWRRDGRGRVTPFGGLRLRPRDLARVGRMLLDGGRWQGHQVVPKAWIDASFEDRMTADGGLRYGYQWWRGVMRMPAGAVPWIAAMGNGGQRLYLVPEQDLVIVVTAGQYNQPETSWRAPALLLRQVLGALPPASGRQVGSN